MARYKNKHDKIASIKEIFPDDETFEPEDDSAPEQSPNADEAPQAKDE